MPYVPRMYFEIKLKNVPPVGADMCLNMRFTSSSLRTVSFTSNYCSALWDFRGAGFQDLKLTFQPCLEEHDTAVSDSEQGAVWDRPELLYSGSHCTCFFFFFLTIHLSCTCLAAFRRLVPPLNDVSGRVLSCDWSLVGWVTCVRSTWNTRSSAAAHFCPKRTAMRLWDGGKKKDQKSPQRQ